VVRFAHVVVYGFVSFSVVLVAIRGVSADVIILEEAAFIKEELFFKIVSPLIGMNKTAILAISTPDDEFNYYSELANLGLFREIYLGKPCDACAESGTPCPHGRKKLPPWKSLQRMDKLDKIIKDKALKDRELHGIINTNKQFLFKKVWIRQFISREVYSFQYNCQVIHCAIDPAGGGEGSDYTIGSCAYENGRKVVSASVTRETPSSFSARTHRHAPSADCRRVGRSCRPGAAP
jgi:hypothetical protein